jgi:hypothetical protein
MLSEERGELDPLIEALKKDVDVSLLDRHLALTPEERIRELIELCRFVDELERAGRAAFTVR